MADKQGKIKVTLRKSAIGYNVRQKKTVQGLGLSKLNSTRVLNDTPEIRGMVQKVIHLVDIEEVAG
ncbi:LSU ribosomal protein L30p (L7e) [hydrothermal vent metagenome]|uniref:LSU ribosomal protein L30p (L7e) n=1 Tax=hydrothermal vent metagenome TaxID=652676 RepID=A0A3B0RFT5_9ZZZZ